MKKSFTDYVNELKIKELENKLMLIEIDKAQNIEDIKKILKKALLK
jgi:hypothetical protein